jgi:hypothetical protein
MTGAMAKFLEFCEELQGYAPGDPVYFAPATLKTALEQKLVRVDADQCFTITALGRAHLRWFGRPVLKRLAVRRLRARHC